MRMRSKDYPPAVIAGSLLIAAGFSGISLWAIGLLGFVAGVLISGRD